MTDYSFDYAPCETGRDTHFDDLAAREDLADQAREESYRASDAQED